MGKIIGWILIILAATVAVAGIILVIALAMEVFA